MVAVVVVAVGLVVVVVGLLVVVVVVDFSDLVFEII